MTAPAPLWRHLDLPALRIALDVFDGGDEPVQGEAGGIVWLLQEHGPVRLGAWSGPGMDLPGWRARFAAAQPQLGRAEPAAVCGRPAARQVAIVRPFAATGLVREPGGALGHVLASPAQTAEIACAFEHAGRPVLVAWSVALGERDAWRASEEHFFASVVCS